jgi:hypothetical protein
LTILIGKLYDYDIPWPYHRFDILPVTVLSYFNYDAIEWEDSHRPIGFFGDSGYIHSTADGVFILDEEFYVIKTVDVEGDDYKICQIGDNPILYNSQSIVSIDSDTVAVSLQARPDLQGLMYVDDQLFVILSDRVSMTDLQFTSEFTWMIPSQSTVTNITGSGEEYFITIYNNDSKETSLWQATGGEQIIELESDVSVPGAIMGRTSDENYLYTTTVEMSENHQQTLVNRTIRDGEYESDYDYVPAIDINLSEITLDSILFDRQLYWGPDTIDIYNHYYNGELTLTNTTEDTIYSANVYSQWLNMHYVSYHRRYNYRLEEQLLPGQSQVISIAYASERQFPDEELVYYCYGYNDRRLEEPIEIYAPLIASSDDIESFDFAIYPNPTQEYLFVESEEQFIIARAEIFDLDGRLVKQFVNPQSRFPVGNLTSGIYHIRVINEDNRSKVLTFYKD